MWRAMQGDYQITFKDLFSFAAIGLLAMAWSLYLSTIFPSSFFASFDVWYGSDISRVVANMSDVESRHGRLRIHPLFSFLILPPTKLLAAVPGVSVAMAIKLVLALFAGTSAAFVYALARTLLKNTFFAVITAVFMLTSSSYVFWSAVPETFIFGSAAISATFFFSIAVNLSARAHLPLHFFTLAFTTTNWVAAILASLSQFKISVVVKLSLIAFVIVVIGSIWQKALLPSAGVFWLPGVIQGEVRFMSLPSLENIPLYGWRALNFIFASIVAPAPSLIGKTVYSSLNYSPIGWIGLISWFVILAAGVTRAFYIQTRRRFWIVVGGFVVFQLILHMIYGDEPFLYSTHFLPALVLIGCVSLTGPQRWFFAALMCVSIGCNLVNNYTRLLEAVALMP